jgi:hypothetical protein
MRKRRWLFLAVILVVGAAWAITNGDGPRKDGGPPFVDLDTLLAGEKKAGWTVFQAPKREGPYRVALGERALVSSGSYSQKIWDRDGTVETITLVASEKEQQQVLVLETRDQHRTLVGLKRSIDPR